jgi:anthranilate phosphoribosyltransferase
VNIAMSPEQAVRAIHEIGLGFLFAPHLHPAMKYAQPVRKELKMRTVFNLLGPLANPARAQAQIIGAPSVATAQLMAEALHLLGTRRSFVVHGHDGMDEVSTTGPTDVFEVTAAGVAKHVWMPLYFGVETARLSDLAGGDVARNAQIVTAILAGETGPRRDIVLVNAAAGLMAVGLAKGPQEGVKLAAEAIDSGKARLVLERLRGVV